ncbi:MAG: nucleotide sugar dehydrogenase [Candidatus Cloacimonetes bacterium]|nr:nucleotide sugar dehydrogenase [Candidatus Cloacimonadota bacterium]
MDLIKKIQDKSAVIGVVGLGYVGLPMAVAVARKGYRVLGVDVSTHAVTSVNKGENYIGDVDDDELRDLVAKGMLSASCEYDPLSEADIIMTAVPTPLDKYQQPDSSYVRSSTDSLAEVVTEQTLIILESTTYPGTTREIVMPALENKGFVIGENMYVAFSPERVDPGNQSFHTANTDKVVGGVTPKCNAIAKAFYEAILDAPIHTVSCPEVAEMEKIYENTFRNINIALANEMTILCERMGINMWEVIEAAKTKPYGFMAFYPGPGIGGHCIPLDPFYLTWKAREYAYHTRLIELAGEINNSMPEYVVQRAIKMLNKRGLSISKAKVLLLGAAYKKDIADHRESPIERVIKELESLDVHFVINDPHVSSFHNEFNGKDYTTVPWDRIKLTDYDIIIIITDHKWYDYQAIVNTGVPILDTRNATKGIKADNIVLL